MDNQNVSVSMEPIILVTIVTKTPTQEEGHSSNSGMIGTPVHTRTLLKEASASLFFPPFSFLPLSLPPFFSGIFPLFLNSVFPAFKHSTCMACEVRYSGMREPAGLFHTVLSLALLPVNPAERMVFLRVWVLVWTQVHHSLARHLVIFFFFKLRQEGHTCVTNRET